MQPPELDEARLRRYARQILLAEIGGRGQRALLAATVQVDLRHDRAAQLVAAAYLAGAGVGTLALVGGEAVVRPVDTGFVLEPSDVGLPLREALRHRLAERTPDVRVRDEIADEEALRLELPADLPAGATDADDADDADGPWARALWRGGLAAGRAITTLLDRARAARQAAPAGTTPR